MIDEKKLIEVLSKNSIFEKITNAEGKNIFEIIKEQPKTDWIPCEERLPSEIEANLVTLDNGEVCIGVYRTDSKMWLTRMIEGETVYTKEHKVLAWQPRPQAYKKEGAENE